MPILRRLLAVAAVAVLGAVSAGTPSFGGIPIGYNSPQGLLEGALVCEDNPSTATGSATVSGECYSPIGSDMYSWDYIGIGSDHLKYWHITNLRSGKCLGAASASLHAGIVLTTCSSNWLTYWRGDLLYDSTEPNTTAQFNIINRMSGYCVAQQGSLQPAGVAAFLWNCNHSYADQSFRVIDRDSAWQGPHLHWYPGYFTTTPT